MASTIRSVAAAPSLDALVIGAALQDDLLSVSALKDFAADIGTTRNERAAFREQQIANAKKAAENAKNVSGWSFFMKYVSYFSSISSLISGTALLATGAGTTAGVALIVTGALTLSTQLSVETGLLALIAEKAAGADPRRAAKIRAQIELGMNISTTILALGTALLSITQITTVATRVVTGTLQGLQSGLQGMGQIGTAVATKAASDTTATARLIQAKVEKSDRGLARAKAHLAEQTDKAGDSLAATYLASLERRIKFTFEQAAGAA